MSLPPAVSYYMIIGGVCVLLVIVLVATTLYTRRARRLRLEKDHLQAEVARLRDQRNDNPIMQTSVWEVLAKVLGSLAGVAALVAAITGLMAVSSTAAEQKRELKQATDTVDEFQRLCSCTLEQWKSLRLPATVGT